MSYHVCPSHSTHARFRLYNSTLIHHWHKIGSDEYDNTSVACKLRIKPVARCLPACNRDIQSYCCSIDARSLRTMLVFPALNVSDELSIIPRNRFSLGFTYVGWCVGYASLSGQNARSSSPRLMRPGHMTHFRLSSTLSPSGDATGDLFCIT